jgi:hypothetical protein
MSSYVDELRDAIRRLHGVESEHLKSVPVKEVFRGEAGRVVYLRRSEYRYQNDSVHGRGRDEQDRDNAGFTAIGVRTSIVPAAASCG